MKQRGVELLEETGLRADLDRISGVYFEPDHDFGPMLHFVIVCRLRDRVHPIATSSEVSDVDFWPLDTLPRPISDFTERRIRDAAVHRPVRVERVFRRQWRE